MRNHWELQSHVGREGRKEGEITVVLCEIRIQMLK